MYTNFNGTALAVSGATQNWTILGASGGLRTASVKNDIFQSLKGDTLAGGLGDDTYNLWDINSKVVEQAGEGIDTVNVRYWGGVTLSDNVENVVLMSPGATWATGNALDNIMIAGTTGATLDGGGGQDVLVGGSGADLFKITKGNGSDVVMNFEAGWDVIDLSGYSLTFAQITANATRMGDDLRIELSGTEGLLLRGAGLSSLDAADFNIFDPVAAPAGYQTLSAAGQAMNYNGWYVINNAWGAQNLVAGTDYILTSSYSATDMTKGTTFNWAFEAKSHDRSILAFPEVAFGYSPFNTSGSNPTDTAKVFPIQVSDMVGLTAQYDVSYQGNLAGFNVAFDIWLASSAVASGKEVITNEVMVWLHKGSFKAFGEKIGTYVDGEFSASIYHEGTYTAFVADKDWTTGTLDIARIINLLKDLSIVDSSEYVRSIDLGAEVASGTGSLVIGNLDLRVETANPAGGTIVKHVDGSGTTVTTIQPQAPLSSVDFSASGYLAVNSDVRAGGMDPFDHYDLYGWKEGRDASASFDTKLYLLHNPDVAAAGMSPLTHFLQYGQKEGRQAHDAIGSHILANGFDAQFYLLNNSDVAAQAIQAGGNAEAFAYQHYHNTGWKQGRDPNAWFDTDGYLAKYTDVAAGNLDPLDHYALWGWKEGRDPSADFDTSSYLAAYTDVAAGELNPLNHYLQYGAYEMRDTFANGWLV